MKVHIDEERETYNVKFESAEEANEVCELLKELLNARKSCRGAIFCTRPPRKKGIDSTQ